MKERTIKMQTTNYKGFVVTLSEADKKGLEKAWKGASKHWKCIVYDKPNRKQMGFDVYGGSKADISPLSALYIYVSDAIDFTMVNDAEDVMNEYGYEYSEAKRVFKSLERTYYKCRKFIGSEADIREIYEELDPQYG